MRQLRAWLLRFKGLFLKHARERELAEELESHLQMHVDDNIRAGMSPSEARRVAMMKLGGVDQAKEAYRDRATIPFLESVVQDLRFTLRQLRKNPAFTVTATMMVALGIGASVAIFAFVDAALIKPLPYRDPARLLYVTETTPEIPHAAISYADFLDWKRLNTVFDSFDVYNQFGFALSTPAGVEMIDGARVSDGFFRTLGVSPMLGRDFYAGEDQPEAPRTLILTHAFWQKRFGGKEDVVGQSMTLDENPYVIVGVLPQHFHFAPVENSEFFTTLKPAATGCIARRSCHFLNGLARLKDGVTQEAARADVVRIAKDLELQYPDSNRNQGATVEPLSHIIVGDVKPVLLLLLGGVGLLLLIACINVASLLLVRAETRRRELSVRRALGATRARLVRQFVIEGLVIVVIGSVAGLLVSHWAMQLLKGLIPTGMIAGMPYLNDLGLNPRVLVFALAIAGFSTLLFALTPSIRLSTLDVRGGMAEGGRGAAGKVWTRIGSKLVVLELTTAMVLLVGAGLLGKSFYRLLQVAPGFETAGLITMRVSAPRSVYSEDAKALALQRTMVSEIGRLPGVTSVALADVMPLTFNSNTDWIRFVGLPYDGNHIEVNQRAVSPDYFATLQAKLLRGRTFTDAEDMTKPRVVVINKTIAERYFPGQDPVGRRLGDPDLKPDSLKEIIGVVDDIREGPLDSEIWPAYYYSLNQEPDTGYAVMVRTSQSEHSLMPVVADAVRGIDSRITISNQTTMTSRMNNAPTVYLRRSSTWLVGGFAAVALLLGVVGLYGVIAYSVSQRTREIGVRIALGAQRVSVYRLILREAGVLALVGIVIGTGCAILVASFMRKLLFGTPPWDVATLVCVALVLGGSALLASFLPARRAASVDPISALRAE
ncbi:MAG TPA: ABC transporter permease [Pyrinomonadaceae bacterium]|nr:ABC transporter permease [Pyrinomonadaceae bacterium]